MVEYTQVPFGDRGDVKKIIENYYEKGWEKDSDIPYNGIYGPDDEKILHLIRYTDAEKAEIEAAKQQNFPQEIVDVNILSVPIIKYEDEMKGADNPYKTLASEGWKEVHRTSTLAIMKLTDPCGVVLSSEDLTMILRGLQFCDPWIIGTQSRTHLDVLYVRLDNILKGRKSPSSKLLLACPDIESCTNKPLLADPKNPGYLLVDEEICIGNYKKCDIYLTKHLKDKIN